MQLRPSVEMRCPAFPDTEVVFTLDNPIEACRASCWNGLHRQLVLSLTYATRHNKSFERNARPLWNIIIECLGRWNMSDTDKESFAVRERIKPEG
jgi:hypothetical protein